MVAETITLLGVVVGVNLKYLRLALINMTGMARL